jgi:hypothetical protein
MSQRPQYPVLLVAAPFGNDDDRAYENWTAMIHLATWADGHGGCGGWHHAPETGLVTCACGQHLYQVGEAAAETDVAA